MKVQNVSADVCGELVKAEISGATVVNIVSDFQGRTTASIQKYHEKLPYKLEIYNAKLGLLFSNFLSSKRACMTRFWDELRHAARALAAQNSPVPTATAEPPADLFDDSADSPTRDDHELNQHEHDKCYW